MNTITQVISSISLILEAWFLLLCELRTTSRFLSHQTATNKVQTRAFIHWMRRNRHPHTYPADGKSLISELIDFWPWIRTLKLDFSKGTQSVCFCTRSPFVWANNPCRASNERDAMRISPRRQRSNVSSLAEASNSVVGDQQSPQRLAQLRLVDGPCLSMPIWKVSASIRTTRLNGRCFPVSWSFVPAGSRLILLLKPLWRGGKAHPFKLIFRRSNKWNDAGVG